MKPPTATTDGVPPGYSPSTASEDKLRRHRRRRRCLCCLICLLVLIALLILLLVLFLVLLRPKDPTATLVSARVTGVSPRVSLPSLSINLNVSLNLVLRVHNPNRASFSHPDPGTSLIYYRSQQVGDAQVEPGKIPARGDGDVVLQLTLQTDKFVNQLGNLVGDVLAGAVGFDVETRIPGKVTILGIVKRHAVAVSKCHVVVGFPDMKVRSQDCNNKTKL